jgi:hypothetical protein
MGFPRSRIRSVSGADANVAQEALALSPVAALMDKHRVLDI